MPSSKIEWIVATYMSTIIGCIISLILLSVLFLFAPAETANARSNEAPYVPQVIPMPQEHAWCYVLVNEQRGIGNIHILSCVPK